jgi:hypothetical protein
VGTSTIGIKHDGNTFSVNHLGLVTQSGLKVSSANTKEGRNDAENILVLNGCDSGATLMGETTAVITSNAGLASCLELKLTNVKNTGENLADLGNLSTGKLKLSESILKDLETLGVVDSNLELGRVTKILPTLLSGAGSARATIQSKMRLLGLTCTSEEIVKNVEVSLSCWNIGDTAALQTMVEKLTTDQDGVGSGRSIILQLVKQTGLGSRRRCSSLCSCETVKNIGSKRKLGREWCRGLVEESSKEVGSNGRLSSTGFTPEEDMLVRQRTTRVCMTYKKTMAWFSDLCPNRRKARSAISSAPAMALPSLPPSGPFDELV